MKRVNRLSVVAPFQALAGLLPWTLALGAPGPPPSIVPGAPEPSPSVAFLVYDAGETLALLPVSDRLAEVGVEVDWIPLTPWAADLLAENGRAFPPLPHSIDTMAHVQGREGVPETGYWESYLARAPPALAVLGMVSAVQGKLAAWLHEAGIPTRGYVDGFQVPGSDAITVRLARGWPGDASRTGPFHEIWVATERVREGFRALGIPTRVAGQPTLESWRRGAQEVNPEAVRQTQGLGETDRVLLWAGQYGDGYAETLEVFLRAVSPILARDSTLVLVLSHHPRTRGEVERAALEEWRAAGEQIRVYPEDVPGPDTGRRVKAHRRAAMMSEDLTTMEMAAAAEVILTWTSTVATQAAFMGKQAVYFSPPEGFDAHLAEEGAAFLADPPSLPATLGEVLGHPRTPRAIRQILLDAGYVVDADRRMAEMILSALVNRKPSALSYPSPSGFVVQRTLMMVQAPFTFANCR